MNQASLAVRKSGSPRGEVGAAVALQLIDVDAAAVDVAHVELVAVLLGVGVAVELVDAAVGRLLVLVLDDAMSIFQVNGGYGPPWRW